MSRFDPDHDCADTLDRQQETRCPGPLPARRCDNGGEPCEVCRGLSDVRVVRSDELLCGRRELFILHQGQVYRLIRTRNDRLILQK